MPTPSRRHALVLSLFGALVAGGCTNLAPSRAGDPPSSAHDEPRPEQPGVVAPRRMSADEVRRKHSRRLASIKTLWVRADFFTAYVFDQPMVEMGDVYLLTRPQDGLVYFNILKLGESIATIGCDAEYFWVIDQAENRAWVGSVDTDHETYFAETPGFVHPHDILPMLGLTNIPADAEIQARSDDYVGDYYNFTFPSRDAGLQVRVWFPATGHEPAQVDMILESGDVIATSRLADYGPLEGADESVSVPRSVTFKSPIGQLQIRLGVQRAMTHTPRGPIGNDVFNAEAQLMLVPAEAITQLAK